MLDFECFKQSSHSQSGTDIMVLTGAKPHKQPQLHSILQTNEQKAMRRPTKETCSSSSHTNIQYHTFTRHPKTTASLPATRVSGARRGAGPRGANGHCPSHVAVLDAFAPAAPHSVWAQWLPNWRYCFLLNAGNHHSKSIIFQLTVACDRCKKTW